jgi:hypothetical protein
VSSAFAGRFRYTGEAVRKRFPNREYCGTEKELADPIEDELLWNSGSAPARLRRAGCHSDTRRFSALSRESAATKATYHEQRI